MRHDPVAGGNVPVLGGADLLATVPGLDAIAEVEPIDLGLTPASHLQFDDLFRIHRRVEDSLAAKTSPAPSWSRARTRSRRPRFCFDLLLAGPKPIVVTGAMRSASQPGFEGPRNLADAIGSPRRPMPPPPISARSSSSTVRSTRRTTSRRRTPPRSTRSGR
jgi:L-asparaginase